MGSVGTFGGMPTDWRVDRAEQIRSLIKEVDPDIVEEIKWRKPSNPDGVPTFSLNGLICTLETYKDKLKLTFAKGAVIPDPDKLFNASLTAGVRRAIDLREDDTLDPEAFKALVKRAVEANR